MSSLYSSNSASILGMNSLFHFSEDGYNAFTESIAPQSLLLAASDISKPEGIAVNILK